jgi:predicted DNA-binding protein with PD1-like motif
MTLHQPVTRRTPFIVALFSSFILLLLLTDGATGWANTQRRKPAHRVTPKLQQTKPDAEAEATGVKTYALRLRPGQDLRIELERFAKRKGIRAGFIITAVGSLQKASLRLANQSNSTSFEDKFEIVSLVGTLSADGPHLHLSLADSSGKTIGGHLVEGSIIYTTAEIVVGELKGVRFTRERDEQTGYQELRIRRQR